VQTPVPLDDVDLRSEMTAPNRHIFQGLLWIAAVGLMTVVGLYLTIPNVPAYPEQTQAFSKPVPTENVESFQPETVKSASEVAAKEKPDSDAATEMVEPPVVNPVTKQETPEERKPVAQREPKVASPKPVVKTQSEKRDVAVQKQALGEAKSGVSKAKPKSKSSSEIIKEPVAEPKPEPVAEEVIEEPAVVETVEPPKPAMGTVFQKGQVKTVRLESKGRDIPLGDVPAGTYTVYATFEGFSEFKVSTLTVEANQSYTIFCDALFATCKVK
jgi:hypothetical protein